MTREEKDMFLETLKSIKPPDEYSSNISRCVQLKERKLMGMKSYDCQMLMQEFLPIADLSKRFNGDDLRFFESRVVVTLWEVRLGGPVPFRWMYHIERDVMTLKSYVSNTYAEGYLVTESLTFCSWYLSGVETLFTRPIRNDDDDGDNQNEIEILNFLHPDRPLGKYACCDLSSLKSKTIPNYEIDGQRCKKDEFGVTLVNFSYALAVRHVKVRDAFNMLCDNDNNHASSSCTIDLPNLDRVGVDVDEVVDGTLVIESKEEVDEDEDEVVKLLTLIM
nr:hypothetical protein [Tanacetum cinerariifolium]GEZ82139.1 hypothetical protein [Tanacetum cinerariifolium]